MTTTAQDLARQYLKDAGWDFAVARRRLLESAKPYAGTHLAWLHRAALDALDHFADEDENEGDDDES